MVAPSRRVSARIGAIAESATLAVDAKAKALKAAGRPVVGFGAGEPDFPTPDYIVEAAVAACRDPRWHRYTPAGGLPELKEAIAAKTLRDSGFEVAAVARCWSPTAASRRSTTPSPRSSTPATRCCSRRRTGRPTPSRSAWPAAIPVEILTDETSGYLATRRAARGGAAPPRTKALVFVSPSNPTGAVYPPEQVAAIGRWAVERGLWVVTDEIYEHLTYGGATFASMPTLVPELADQCVVVNGVAKTYAMTGWRVGWMIGPSDVVKAATNLQSHATSNVSNVAQVAALAAVSGDLSAVAMMREAFDRRRQTMVGMLEEIPGVDLPGAVRRVLRLPLGQGRARPGDPRAATGHLGRAGRAHPRRGRGGGRARARRSARPATSGSPTPWATPTSSKASAASTSSSPRRPTERRSPAAASAARRPAAAQGAPAPALHGRHAARDDARPGRAARRDPARRPARPAAAPARPRPTSAAGSGSSGCTTPPGR